MIPEEAAFWADYGRLDDMDALRKEGWVSPYDVAAQTGQPASILRQRMAHDRSLESRLARVFQGEKTREIRIYRRKLPSKISDKGVKG